MVSCTVALLLAASLVSGAAFAAGTPGLGKKVTESDIKAWNITILPEGINLPPGSGTAAQGATIFAEKCALCHDALRLYPAGDAVADPAYARRWRSLCALRYILSQNQLIGENDTMKAQTLPKVRMPNRDNFITRLPDKIQCTPIMSCAAATPPRI